MVNASDFIEALDSIAPGLWRQLTNTELKNQGYADYLLGWRIELGSSEIAASDVNHLVILIDNRFPFSQIRVVAPQLGSNFIWPHVEEKGFLCLRPTLTTANIEKRIEQHFKDAINVLSLTEEEVKKEFAREFIAYWGQRSTKSQRELSILSLVCPSYQGKELFYFYILSMKAYVVSESKKKLDRWLKNLNVSFECEKLNQTILYELEEPWLPKDFPENASVFVDEIDLKLLRQAVNTKTKTPILIRTKTSTGTVFVAILINTPEKKKLQQGFSRGLDSVPDCRYKNLFKASKVVRLMVERVDAAWVHGRGHSLELPQLLERKVLLVGCGSLGSKIAKVLSEAGVGEQLFIDGDIFKSHNSSRHLLGVNSINQAKSIKLAQNLAKAYPHLGFNTAATIDFEHLTQEQLKSLEDIDIIVTAGIDYEGEQAVEAWRKSLEQPPMLVSSWVEPYALAGHAVLLINRDALLDKFGNEVPTFHLIKWPEDMQLEIIEAGCGNTFQPHGAVDLNYTANMAAKCVLNALLGFEQESVVYSWLGDTSKIQALGGDVKDSSLTSEGYFQRAWSTGL